MWVCVCLVIWCSKTTVHNKLTVLCLHIALGVRRCSKHTACVYMAELMASVVELKMRHDMQRHHMQFLK
jgi:hypothetical protein